MLEQIVLGIVQGIVEWLPVSSEGILVLIQSRVFGDQGFREMVQEALFLHVGTFLAALIYFRSEVIQLIRGIFRFKQAEKKTKSLLKFILISTLISGLIGFILLETISSLGKGIGIATKIITFAIGALLLITGLLQIKVEELGLKKIKDLKSSDSVVLGIIQGLAALPGFSRSGLTVSALLLRKFEKRQALKISFLMSLPIVLGGNIILNIGVIELTMASFLGLALSFIFGLATIHFLLKLAAKVNFGYFVFGFGLLTVVLAFI